MRTLDYTLRVSIGDLAPISSQSEITEILLNWLAQFSTSEFRLSLLDVADSETATTERISAASSADLQTLDAALSAFATAVQGVDVADLAEAFGDALQAGVFLDSAFVSDATGESAPDEALAAFRQGAKLKVLLDTLTRARGR